MPLEHGRHIRFFVLIKDDLFGIRTFLYYMHHFNKYNVRDEASGVLKIIITSLAT